MGPGRRPLRDARHLVPPGRRPLYRLHLHRRAGAGLRRRRIGVLRRALHHHGLSLRLRRVPAAVVVARRHGYITSADFVRGRFGNKWLALVIALTGIVATMPYIALQLVGIQVVIAAMGVESTGLLGDLPLIIAFVILAAFTYTSGLRAP